MANICTLSPMQGESTATVNITVPEYKSRIDQTEEYTISLKNDSSFKKKVSISLKGVGEICQLAEESANMEIEYSDIVGADFTVEVETNLEELEFDVQNSNNETVIDGDDTWFSNFSDERYQIVSASQSYKYKLKDKTDSGAKCKELNKISIDIVGGTQFDFDKITSTIYLVINDKFKLPIKVKMPQLDVDKNTFSFTSTGGSDSFVITTNSPWTIE